MSTTTDRAEHRAARLWGKDDGATEADKTSQSVDVERLVSAYARIGQQQRNSRRSAAIRRLYGSVLGGLVLVAVAVLYLDKGALVLLKTRATEPAANAELTRVTSEVAEVRALQSVLARELEVVARQRQDLERQRSDFASALEGINNQRSALLEQSESLEVQREQLAGAIAALDEQKQAFDAEKERIDSERPELQGQIAELERQRLLFKDQRELLASEISELGAQRTVLEQQRDELERQWQDLQVLMDSMEGQGATPSTQPQPEPVSLRRDSSDEPFIAPILTPAVAAVTDDTLGQTRGGIRVGDDLTIAIGLTRSGSVNGVEQYSSVLRIDDLAAMNLSGRGIAGATLIQNGSGNLVSPAVLDSLSNGYATIIQNSLDNQHIETRNVFDIAIGNVDGAARGISAINAIGESLSMHR